MAQLNLSYDEVFSDVLVREYEIKVDSKTFDRSIEDMLFNIQKDIKIDGFRPGKVPLNLIKKKHMDYVLQETASDLMSKALTKFFEEAKVVSSEQPKISNVEFGEGKDFKFKAKFEIMPMVPEIKFEEINLEVYDINLPEEDIQKELDYVKSLYKKFDKLENPRSSQKGDQVVIDFVGRIDGVEFEGGAAEDYELELGSKNFIGNFEEQLEGKNIGDKVLVKVNFPENYFKEELQNKPAEFDVTIKNILEPVAQSDEEFAIADGHEDFAALRKNVIDNLKKHYDSEAKILAKKRLYDVWDNKYNFDLPTNMIEAELKKLKAKYGAAVHNHDHEHEHDENCNHDHDHDHDNKNIPSDEKLEKFAKRRVKLGIILADVAAKNDIKATNEDIQNAIYEQAMYLRMNVETVNKFFQNNPKAVQMIVDSVIEEKTSNWLLDNIKLNKKEIAKDKFQDILKKEYDENDL